jgi:hypothetical protein
MVWLIGIALPLPAARTGSSSRQGFRLCRGITGSNLF